MRSPVARSALAALVLAVLAACAPALAPTATRAEGSEIVPISLYVNSPAFDVTLTIIGGVIEDDERCFVSAGDTVCFLGDVTAGETFSFLATGVALSCHAGGFTRDGFDPRAYRFYTCRSGR